VLRTGVAVTGEARELASLLAAGLVVGDRELRPVGEPDAAHGDPTSELLLHDADQLDQATQPPVVLRLLGQMRKPARQRPPTRPRNCRSELIPIAA
jgi:hypothetical protein